MMKFLKCCLYIITIILIYNYRNEIYEKISYMLCENNIVTINDPNTFYKVANYNFVSESDTFIPYSKQDLLNIYYSVLNRGYDTFTFYCPKEYTLCISDLESLLDSEDDLVSYTNYFVSPFNSEKKLNTKYSSNGEITISIEKLYTDDQIKEINDKIDEIIKNNINDNMNILDKVLTIHDYIINNTVYDSAAINKSSSYHSNIAYGALIEGYATCNGYADAMALFLDRFNIKNYRVISDTHIWNALYINNEWVHLDLTWDDPVSANQNVDTLIHKFYLINTKTLEDYQITDHNFNKKIYTEVS